MASICYSWEDAIYSWENASLTWKEFCVIQKLISSNQQKKAFYRDKNKKQELTDDEKQILIKLITRLKTEEEEFENKLTKIKNTDININVSNLDLLKTENKIIYLCCKD